MAESRAKSDTMDAGRQHLGTVYAKALLGAAEKAGQADQVVDELESLIHDVLDKHEKLGAILMSLRLTHEERLPILEKAFGGKLSPTLMTFLKVVSKHGRLGALRAIARRARKQLNVARGRVEVLVETAHPLSNPLRDRITSRLSELLGKQVILNTRINEDLLGGLMVRVGDTVYDASLAASLKRMEQVTLEHTKEAIRKSIERFAITT
jgi:F-type H+-transporting ATPase subunit delta